MAIDINEILNTEPELSRIADRARRRLKVMSIDAAYVKAKWEADHYVGMNARLPCLCSQAAYSCYMDYLTDSIGL